MRLAADALFPILLSTMNDVAAVNLVKKRGFVVPARFGKPVVRDEATLIRELAATRARGYGMAIEEGEPGTCAMALAILGRDGLLATPDASGVRAAASCEKRPFRLYR